MEGGVERSVQSEVPNWTTEDEEQRWGSLDGVRSLLREV